MGNNTRINNYVGLAIVLTNQGWSVSFKKGKDVFLAAEKGRREVSFPTGGKFGVIKEKIGDKWFPTTLDKVLEEASSQVTPSPSPIHGVEFVLMNKEGKKYVLYHRRWSGGEYITVSKSAPYSLKKDAMKEGKSKAKTCGNLKFVEV